MVLYEKSNLFLHSVFFFHEDFPIWYESRSVQFPESEYVSAIGNGFNEQMAKETALATLSLYFESNITVQRLTNLYGTENSFGVAEKMRSISSETGVKSETKLPSVSFTNSFYNSARNEFYVCAYIKRRDAINEYSGKLAVGISRANEQIKRAECEKNSFSAFSLAKKTNKALGELESDAIYLSVLDGKTGVETLKSIEILSGRCADVMSKIKPKLTFVVKIQNDSDNSIAYTLQNLLEAKGFSCGKSNPSFVIDGNLNFTESKNAVGVFVRPVIFLQVYSSSSNEQLSSYTRQYPKYGHNNLDNAYAKVRVEIEKDLKANFLDSIFEN